MVHLAITQPEAARDCVGPLPSFLPKTLMLRRVREVGEGKGMSESTAYCKY